MTNFFNVESIIAHEYFHNWTGNRVTCRDWFQLSLKEGLTVFRDQQFSTDMTSALSNRIKQVRVMREHQFAEDASAMSHPIRPDEVIEMNNFYTVTVYDKGAEVIRMLHTLLGQRAFRTGIDTYFERHDGQAVTCDDFVNAMQSATDLNLDHFKRWYSQSGTPELTVNSEFDGHSSWTISVSQHTPATADQSEKHPLYVPINIELIDAEGTHYNDNEGLIEEGMLVLDKPDLSFTVNATCQPLIPVVLGNFSAPVKVKQSLSFADSLSIFKYAKDAFSRWNAIQSLYEQCISNLLVSPTKSIADEVWDGLRLAIENEKDNIEFLSECLVIPSFETLCQSRTNIDVAALIDARNTFCKAFAVQLSTQLVSIYQQCAQIQGGYAQQPVIARRCKNVILAHLAQLPEFTEVIEKQYYAATTMTDSLGALKASQYADSALFDKLMQQFESKWKDDPLVLDKWFALHATQGSDDILATLTMLQEHPLFSINNPNRVRSILGSFAFYNSEKFHALDGSGYKYVTDYLLKLDSVNPQVASRIVTPLTQWQQYNDAHQSLMKAQLSRLLNHKGLSKDLFEKVSKSLSYGEHH